MKAAVAWKAGEPLKIETIEVAAPKENEVRIEIYYTGVCHTGKLLLTHIPSILCAVGCPVEEDTFSAIL